MGEQLQAIHEYFAGQAAERICRRYEKTMMWDDQYERCFRVWSR
jgi:hypothetical protein